MGVSKTDFGVTRDGRKACLYTIINKNGMEAVVSDFGAILVKLIVPNKDGEKSDVCRCHCTGKDSKSRDRMSES